MIQQQFTFPKKATIFGPNTWMDSTSCQVPVTSLPMEMTVRATKTLILDHDRQTIEVKNIDLHSSRRRSTSKKRIFETRNSYSVQRHSSPFDASRSQEIIQRELTINHFSKERGSQSKELHSRKPRKHKIFGLEYNLQVQEARQSRVNEKLREMISNRNDKADQSMGYASHILKNSRKVQKRENQNVIPMERSKQILTPAQLTALLHQMRLRNQKHRKQTKIEVAKSNFNRKDKQKR